MADQIDPEQITRASEAFELLANAVGKSKTAEEKKLDAYERFGKQLGKSAADLGSSLYKGEKGVGQFGDAVESATGALSMLVLALGPFSLAAKAVAVGLALLGKGINAAAKQGDALYKSYQDLSRAGATASDGISGVFRNMQNLGYGIEELDKMVALVTQNSETLAKFSMSAADGTNAFAQGMAQIQRDGGLRLLGKTTDDINSAGAAFIRQQVAMGRRQNDVQGQLGDRTKAYVLELDRLQRLTGTSADALQKQQEDMLSEDAYNVYMEMLESQGDAGKAQIEKIRAVTAQLPADYQKLVAQSIGGNVEAQQKLMFIAPNLIKDLQDPIKSTADTTKTLNADLKNFKGILGKNYLIDPSMREFGGRIVDLNQAIAQTSDIDERNKSAAAGTKVQDTATKALTEAQIANMNSRDAMQAFIQRGVAPATVALAALAKGASALAGGAAGAVGAPTGGAAAGGAGGGGASGGGTGGGGSGSYIDQIDSGIKGPSTLRRFGMAIGAVGAGPGAGLTGKDISGLSPGLAQALQQAAAEYNQITGKTVEVTSAVRDSAKQAELYQAYVSGKSNFPAAPPGSSKHERGLAVDISQAVADDMDRMGLLKKYGLSRPVANDPVHLEVSAANGAILSGPMSGYRPNLTMHGTEAIVPLNSPAAQSAFGSSDQTNLMSAQLDKLDELVRVMQNQVSVSTKILQAAA